MQTKVARRKDSSGAYNLTTTPAPGVRLLLIPEMSGP